MADIGSLDIPEGFASLEEFMEFTARLGRARPQIELLHAMGACHALAAALNGQPFRARARLVENDRSEDAANVAFEIATTGRDAAFIDSELIYDACSDWIELGLHGAGSSPGKPPIHELFPTLDAGASLEQMMLCRRELDAAFAHLLNGAPGLALTAYAENVAVALPTRWFHQGDSAAKIALAIGLPEIAARVEAHDLALASASAPSRSRPTSI